MFDGLRSPLISGHSLRKWALQQSRSFSYLFYLGIFFALLEATVWPLFSLVFAQALGVIIQKDPSASSMALWCGLFVVVGAGNMVSSYGRLFFCNLAGARLTEHLRNTLFKHYMRQEISWFDDKAHSQGSLWALAVVVHPHFNG